MGWYSSIKLTNAFLVMLTNVIMLLLLFSSFTISQQSTVVKPQVAGDPFGHTPNPKNHL